MKFKYYITDTTDGVVEGTNDEAVATTFAKDPDYFVVEAETGLWLQCDGTRDAIQAIAASDGEG